MTYVYIITAENEGGPCKVGVSTNPDYRLTQLQTGSPHRLDLRETYWMDTRGEALDLERQFHEAHADVRLSGEWFALDFEDANYWLFRRTVLQ